MDWKKISKRKWQKLIYFTVFGYFENNIGRTAAAMTYYLVFAIFPFLIFVTSLLGLLDLPMLTLEGEMTKFLPADVVGLLNIIITHITENSNNALLTFGLVFTVWFPLRAVSNLMKAVNDIYESGINGVHYVRTAIITVLMIVLIPVLVILLLLGERLLRFVSIYVPLAPDFIDGFTKMRFFPMAMALLFVLSAIYYLSPAQKQPPRYVLPGALMAVVIWILFSFVFSIYVNQVGRYSVIYGSIGVIIALLVWLNFSMMTMLMGAVFNVAIKKTFQKGTEKNLLSTS